MKRALKFTLAWMFMTVVAEDIVYSCYDIDWSMILLMAPLCFAISLVFFYFYDRREEL